MTDADQVSQALAELQEVVRCRCDEAYRDRGLHDPQCECHSAEAVKIVADRIEELEAKLAECEARLGKAVEALRPFAEVLKGNYSHQSDGLPISMGHGKDDLRWVLPLGKFRLARATIAEIKSGVATTPYGLEGESHDPL